ncbi:hypothetical protein HK100_002537 [Physocladia obscura]|uniref:Uncharacterized protein n=1 Tax=Physocladia obscura TaxID=109957 RepID=A0AAD5SVM9_9FUNG|nr:hypothetical protein HK100_002537 [Physocladia obscura]
MTVSDINHCWLAQVAYDATSVQTDTTCCSGSERCAWQQQRQRRAGCCRTGPLKETTNDFWAMRPPQVPPVLPAQSERVALPYDTFS